MIPLVTSVTSNQSLFCSSFVVLVAYVVISVGYGSCWKWSEKNSVLVCKLDLVDKEGFHFLKLLFHILLQASGYHLVNLVYLGWEFWSWWNSLLENHNRNYSGTQNTYTYSVDNVPTIGVSILSRLSENPILRSKAEIVWWNVVYFLLVTLISVLKKPCRGPQLYF